MRRAPACSAVAAWVWILGSALYAGAPGQQPSATAAELRTKFEHTLADIAAHLDGVMGYVVLDLTSGDRFAHLDREIFPTASTIKLAIVYELFKQVDEGKVRLDEKIGTYLTGLPDAWTNITVRQLLTHTSGIKGYTEVSDLAAELRAAPGQTDRMVHDSMLAHGSPPVRLLRTLL